MNGIVERMIFVACYVTILLLPLTLAITDVRIKREIELQNETTKGAKNNAIAMAKILSAGNKTGLLQERILPFESDQARPIPASIEVELGSNLWAQPGRPANINFAVTNNRAFPTNFQFNVRIDQDFVRMVKPLNAEIFPGSTALVQVEIVTTQRSSTPAIISFRAGFKTETGEYAFVNKNVYFYSSNPVTDSWRPNIWYTYTGDCSYSQTQHNCKAKTWRVDLSIQDYESGLLKIKSEPVGLTLNKEFIVGTKEVVEGFYFASCCHTKVDITAVDTLGNYKTLTIDIDKRWLSVGEISAIALGVIVLLIIISVIIFCIVRCCRKKHTLDIYPRHRPTSD